MHMEMSIIYCSNTMNSNEFWSSHIWDRLLIRPTFSGPQSTLGWTILGVGRVGFTSLKSSVKSRSSRVHFFKSSVRSRSSRVSFFESSVWSRIDPVTLSVTGISFNSGIPTRIPLHLLPSWCIVTGNHSTNIRSFTIPLHCYMNFHPTGLGSDTGRVVSKTLGVRVGSRSSWS